MLMLKEDSKEVVADATRIREPGRRSQRGHPEDAVRVAPRASREPLRRRYSSETCAREVDDMVDEYLGSYGDLVTAAGALGLSECQGVLL